MILMKQIILSLSVFFVLIGTTTAHASKVNQNGNAKRYSSLRWTALAAAPLFTQPLRMFLRSTV